MSISVYGFAFYRPLDNVTLTSHATDSPPNWHFDFICKRNYSLQTVSRIGGGLSLTGKGVDIYLFSTGVNIHHSELQSRAFLLPGYASTLAADEDVSGVDCAEEGTYLAGLCIGEFGGIARRANLYSAKITNENYDFSLEDFSAAVSAAISNKSVRNRPVIALISYYRAPTLESRILTTVGDEFEREVQRLCDAGFFVISPAGDGFKDNELSEAFSYLNSRVVSPARMEDVIAVGAIDPNLNITENTCYGEPVDFYAPGRDIKTINLNDTLTKPRTSSKIAAAIAAGCAALYLEKLPGSSLKEYRSFIRKHYPEIKPPNYPNDVLDGDAILGSFSGYEYGITFGSEMGVPVSYIPEPIALQKVRYLKAFFTKGVLDFLPESGNLGTALFPGSFRFQLNATSKNLFQEDRPVEFYLVDAPKEIKIGKYTGILYGETPNLVDQTINFDVWATDGVYSEKRTYTLNIIQNPTSLQKFSGKVQIKKKDWQYLRSSSTIPGSDLLDSSPLEISQEVVYPEKREVALMDKDSGSFVDSTISHEVTGAFSFEVLPGNYQVIVKHRENERYQIQDLRIG